MLAPMKLFSDHVQELRPLRVFASKDGDIAVFVMKKEQSPPQAAPLKLRGIAIISEEVFNFVSYFCCELSRAFIEEKLPVWFDENHHDHVTAQIVAQTGFTKSEVSNALWALGL